jgi:hypothetical protein
MTEKLTMKKLSEELERLRAQMLELEARLERNFETRLDSALAAAAPRAKPGNTPVSQTGIDTKQRQRLITEEAYLIAERRGFQGGDPSQDWAEAEKLVDYRLMQSGEPEQSLPNAPESRKKTTRSTKKPAPRKKAGEKTSGSVKS